MNTVFRDREGNMVAGYLVPMDTFIANRTGPRERSARIHCRMVAAALRRGIPATFEHNHTQAQLEYSELEDRALHGDHSALAELAARAREQGRRTTDLDAVWFDGLHGPFPTGGTSANRDRA